MNDDLEKMSKMDPNTPLPGMGTIVLMKAGWPAFYDGNGFWYGSLRCYGEGQIGWDALLKVGVVTHLRMVRPAPPVPPEPHHNQTTIDNLGRLWHWYPDGVGGRHWRLRETTVSYTWEALHRSYDLTVYEKVREVPRQGTT